MQQIENRQETDRKQIGNGQETDKKQIGNRQETDRKQIGNIYETEWNGNSFFNNLIQDQCVSILLYLFLSGKFLYNL